MRVLDYILISQGIYYGVTSLWPFIHLASFEAVVGFKPDKFQLFTTSLLIFVIAVTLLMSVGQKKSRELLFLSVSTPLAFILVELWFRNRIKPIFMLEAIVELLLIAAISLSFVFHKTPLNRFSFR